MKLLTGLLLAAFVSFVFFLGFTHAQLGQGQGFGQGQGQGQGQGFGQGQGQGIGDAVGILAKALYCFNDKYIYSSCTEAYRLNEHGELPVPPEETDKFCEGPCQEETSLVLNCIEGVMQNFLFYNKATTQDVRKTVAAGCSYGATRGDFDVARYIDEGSAGLRAAAPVLTGIGTMIIGWILMH